MSIRKSAAVLLSVLFLLLSFSACGSPEQPEQETQPSEVTPTGIYCLEDYEDAEVFDFEKVELSEALAETCLSYKFTYISDGYRIIGYISLPLEAVASQKPCKAVIYNRGGNSQIGTLEKDTTANVCSVCGRIVIASQYRGAGGSQGTDEFGGDDVNDVIKLIDLCEDRFRFVDMDDLCVAGISRGGMMTYLTARGDSRVKRIVAVSAVSDLTKAYGEREDMQDLLYNCIGFTPQENPAEYEKRSAICWADEIKVPVLMIHSRGDQKVSYEQAQALYEKLKDTTECHLITYDDDLHDFHFEDRAIIREWLETGTVAE